MSSVVPFPSQGRSAEAIRAEMTDHIAALRSLTFELATVLGCDPVALGTGASERAGGPQAVPTAERRETKQKAAGALGISEARLMRLMVRYHAAYPDRPKLGVQPAGMKSSPWTIFTDRVRAVMESGEP